MHQSENIKIKLITSPQYLNAVQSRDEERPYIPNQPYAQRTDILSFLFVYDQISDIPYIMVKHILVLSLSYTGFSRLSFCTSVIP